MKIIMRLFAVVHGLLALVFVGASVFLLAAAVHEGWLAWQEGLNGKAAQVVIEAIGLAAIAVVSLQIAQTIAEEEILRETHVSGPTRVRRFLSRFLVVVIVALAIEGLIATFKALHESMDELVPAASVVAAVGIILAGWGAFIRFNVPAEKLEPEAMQEAKEEDRKLR
ncbi:MAG TPA: hypothetical protein VFJ62_11010 [Usitatibacter sp.]|nr:hypothetical protein [Usitatibacter sp.]